VTEVYKARKSYISVMRGPGSADRRLLLKAALCSMSTDQSLTVFPIWACLYRPVMALKVA
jgi:hypothetical protein